MLLVAGDFHAQVIRAGIALLDPATRQILESHFGPIKVRAIMTGPRAYGPFFQACAEGLSMSDTIAEGFAALTEGAGTIVPNDCRMFGFSFGLQLFGFHRDLLGSSHRWIRHSLIKSDDRQFVSQAVIREIILHHGQYVLQFARMLKQMGVAAFFIGPPPVRRKHIELYAPSMRDDEILLLQASVWSVMGDALKKIGIPVVLAPPEAISGGMLRPEFESDRPDNSHHANSKYGSLVWQQIAASAASGDLAIPKPSQMSC